jgi:hypothetical protein
MAADLSPRCNQSSAVLRRASMINQQILLGLGTLTMGTGLILAFGFPGALMLSGIMLLGAALIWNN